jgi:hypothetical protein
MSHTQFVEAMAVASALNTLSVVAGIVVNNAQLRKLRAHVDDLFDHVDLCFDELSDPAVCLSAGLLDRFELEFHYLPTHHVTQIIFPKLPITPETIY